MCKLNKLKFKDNNAILHSRQILTKCIKNHNIKQNRWSNNSFCILHINNYFNNNQIHNKFKNIHILVHTHYESKQALSNKVYENIYTLLLPIQLFTENTQTYLNIEGKKQETKKCINTQPTIMNTVSIFEMFKNKDNILHKINKKELITYKFSTYFEKNKINFFNKQNTINNNLQFSVDGIQYSNFVNKNYNHNIHYSFLNILNITYTNMSYITNNLTSRSIGLLHMYRKSIQEQYSSIYYI